MNNKILTIILILACTIFTIHIFNVKTEGARVDLTETKLFSLTEGTHQILEKMNDEGVKPIEIKLYFSQTAGKTLPKFIKNFIVYKQYVHNLLKEYERYSDGKIRITAIDPKPDSDEAEDATDYRLDGKPINQEGDLFFFGLVFETQTGSKDVIEFLWPEKQENIEYEISKRIYSLLWPKRSKIGIMAGLDVLPDNNPYMAQMLAAQGKRPSEPWMVMDLLKESYEAELIGEDKTQISPDEFDLVLVVHPRNFTEKQLWMLDEWTVTGGATIVLVDGYAIDDQPPQNPQQPWAQLQYKPSSNLPKLMDNWGLTRPEDMFAADYDLGLKRQVDRNGGAQKVITDLVIDQTTAPKVFNQDLPIFQGLSNVRFFLAGALEKKEGAETKLTPLIQTTEESGLLKIKPGFGDRGELAFTDLQNPNKLIDALNKGTEPVTLAYLVEGKIKSAFPEGAKFPKETPKPPPGMPPGFQMPADENAEMIETQPVPADKMADARILVFSDVDFISDQLAFQKSIFGVQAVNDNHKILLNSLDFLLGSKELMNVRSKQNIRRPFTRFDQIEAAADKQLLDQERRIRADIDRFEEELRTKQRGINEKNATLFQKQVNDDITKLNDKIREGNKELREIKKLKRAALEHEEAMVSFSIMWFMPILVCIGGLVGWFRRKKQQQQARGR